MDSIHVSTPWHRSVKFIIAAAILLPPVGLVLLWMRKDTERGQKVFGSVGIIALTAVYGFLFFGRGVFVAQPDPSSEAHYAELEQHRLHLLSSVKEPRHDGAN